MFFLSLRSENKLTFAIPELYDQKGPQLSVKVVILEVNTWGGLERHVKKSRFELAGDSKNSSTV